MPILCSFRLPCLVGAVVLAAAAGPADPGPVAPVRMARSSAVVTMEADGTAVQLLHLEFAVGTDAAARQAAQQSASYLDEVERLSLVDAATIKPDGRRIGVAPDAVRTQLAPGLPNVPMYTNRRVMTAVLPEVAAGDILSVTWKREILSPPIPGHLTWTSTFARILPWDDATVTISVPAGVALRTEEWGPAHEVEAEGGRTVHRWHFAAPGQATDPAALLPIDRVPRFFASTFADWAALSRAYAAVVEPNVAVTPTIQAKADELAAGAADKAGEAKRIVDWVSRHVRWVAVYVNNGGYVPHPAEQVLKQGYGDCKDQVMLTVALLRARGIAADPVLINLGNTYRLPGAAVLSAFDHVITHMPELDVYADTTAGGSPWGVLPAREYGKPVLPVTAAGSSATRLPVTPPGLAAQRLRTEARLEADGTVTGQTRTEAQGPYAIFLRQAAARVEASGSERAAAEALTRNGTPGQGSYQLDPLDPPGPTYAVAGSFTLAKQPGWLDGEAFGLPTGLRSLERTGDGLLGALSTRDLPASEPTPCWAGVQEEDVSLALPPGYRPARLPQPRTAAGDAFSFESRWSFADGVLRNTRRLESRIDTPLCEGPVRAAARTLLEQVRRDLGTRVELVKAEGE